MNISRTSKIFDIIFMLTIFIRRQIEFYFGYALRIFNIDITEKYSSIKKYRNKHEGERCFIVGTGPSLKIEDLDAIKDEYSFSVNSIVLSFPETCWRPTYYAIQDNNGYEKLKDYIKIFKIPIIFNGISDKSLTPKMDFVNYVPFPLNLLDHGKPSIKQINKFSDDAYKVVYDGHSITYSVMQLAVYMGFKEIVLLGVDCDYSKKINHLKAYSPQTDNNAAFLMRESYKVAQKYAISHGINIYNATRNPNLDVFEKKELKSILGKNK